MKSVNNAMKISLKACGIILAGVIFYLQGCTSSSKSGSDFDVSLQEAESLYIPLDSCTSQTTNYIQVIDDSHIAFLNVPNYDICVYDIDQNETSKIQLYKDGPDKVTGVDAFCIVSPDSVWLYSSWGRVVTRVNDKGEVLESHQVIEPVDSRYSVLPYPMTSNPYVVQESRHILHGMSGPMVEGQRPAVTLIYDTESETVTEGNQYPAVYGSAKDLSRNWSVFGYLLSAYDLMPSGLFLTSFAASDSLYVYNPEDNSQKAFFAGYSSPVKVHKGPNSSREAEFVNHIEYSQYGGVFYDAENDVYYRLLGLPLESYDKDDLRNEIRRKPIAVIIIDGELNKIGETVLPQDSYNPSNTFVTSAGLHVNVESQDDDLMKFRVFKLLK